MSPQSKVSLALKIQFLHQSIHSKFIPASFLLIQTWGNQDVVVLQLKLFHWKKQLKKLLNYVLKKLLRHWI